MSTTSSTETGSGPYPLFDSGSVRLWELRFCCMVLSHVICGRPHGLLQSSGGRVDRIFLASVLSSIRAMFPERVTRCDWSIAVMNYVPTNVCVLCTRVFLSVITGNVSRRGQFAAWSCNAGIPWSSAGHHTLVKQLPFAAIVSVALLSWTEKIAMHSGNVFIINCNNFPSLPWHCWLGDRKGIQPVKKVEMGKNPNLWVPPLHVCCTKNVIDHKTL